MTSSFGKEEVNKFQAAIMFIHLTGGKTSKESIYSLQLVGPYSPLHPLGPEA